MLRDWHRLSNFLADLLASLPCLWLPAGPGLYGINLCSCTGHEIAEPRMAKIPDPTGEAQYRPESKDTPQRGHIGPSGGGHVLPTPPCPCISGL